MCDRRGGGYHSPLGFPFGDVFCPAFLFGFCSRSSFWSPADDLLVEKTYQFALVDKIAGQHSALVILLRPVKGNGRECLCSTPPINISQLNFLALEYT